MLDRKMKNGAALLHFSVLHFSVRLISVAETTTEAGAQKMGITFVQDTVN
jgi:hypothetical protein